MAYKDISNIDILTRLFLWIMNFKWFNLKVKMKKTWDTYWSFSSVKGKKTLYRLFKKRKKYVPFIEIVIWLSVLFVSRRQSSELEIWFGTPKTPCLQSLMMSQSKRQLNIIQVTGHGTSKWYYTYLIWTSQCIWRNTWIRVSLRYFDAERFDRKKTERIPT